VSPEELALALAALELRRDGQVSDSSISLGDAIQQLGLDVSAADLLREVEAYRAAEARQRRAAAARREIRIASTVIVVTLLVLVAVTALCIRGVKAERINTPPVSAPPAVASVPSYVPLASLQEGAYARCDFDTLRGLARGEDSSRVYVDTRDGGPSTMLWELTKRKGELFVRCWADERTALKAINGHNAVIFCSEYPDGYITPRVSLEIPLKRFAGAQAMNTVTFAEGGTTVIAAELHP
jgi:hypothetical protein